MRGFGRTGRCAADWLKLFARAQRGNTAVIFAIASVSLLSAGGAGIDLARTMMVKSELAGALDAAALAVGATQGLSTAQVQTKAQQYFDANYHGSSIATVNPVVVSQSGQAVSLSVSGKVPTTLLQILNIDDIDVGVANEVVRSITKLRIALVLDVTGSMAASGKIRALRDATHQLLTQLEDATVNPGDVQVSIIPFSLDVNVGTTNANATWIDWSNYAAAPPNSPPNAAISATNWAKRGPNGEAQNGNCPFSTGTSPYGYGCINPATGNTTSTIPSSGVYKGYICPGTDNGNYNSGRRGHIYNGCFNSVKTNSSCSSNCTYTHAWVPPANHNAWGGCVMDRDQNNDYKATTPVNGNAATMFKAENNTSCPPVQLMPISTNWSALHAKVDQLTPNGSTNQTIGLAWGLQSLTTGDPLNTPAYDPDTQRVIVLLSDGLNTQDRWYGNGSAQSSQVDDRMALACAYAKQQNALIYSVLVMAGNSAVLENCATDPQKYYALTTAGQIVTTFNTIGTELANLHLSR